MAEIKKIKLSDIKPNDNNPRYITDVDFKDLVKSIKEFPQMADEAREIVVNKDLMILGGNMRYRAMLEAGWTEANVKIVNWPQAMQDEFIIKDNVSKGDWDWDVLANKWDEDLLRGWGLPLPNYHNVNSEDMEDLQFDDALNKNDEYQIIVTFQNEEAQNEFLLNANIKLDKNFIRRNNKISFSWPLEGKKDIKNVKFE